MPPPDSLNSIASQILARATSTGLDVYDTEIRDTPAGPYLLLTGDGGLPLYQTLSGTPRKRLHTVQVMAVSGPGGTPSACRNIADQASVLLDGWAPTGGHPLRQVGAGPVLSGGPPGDVRHTITLTYQTRA